MPCWYSRDRDEESVREFGAVIAPGLARHPGALDVEREERRRHGARRREPRLVHAEPRHPQRDLLPARRLGVHARSRVDRDRRRVATSRKRSATRARTSRCSRPACPHFTCATSSLDGRYRIDKDVLTDPSADVVLQRVRFSALQGTLADYRLYALLAPHLNNHGAGNTAWIGDYKGVPMLYARARRLRARAGVFRAVARAIGRLRRLLRRLAAAASRRTHRRRHTSARRTATSP